MFCNDEMLRNNWFGCEKMQIVYVNVQRCINANYIPIFNT